MCGVLLIYSKKKKLNKIVCSSASEYIKSRGPDHFFENYFLENRLYISNSVLSIVGNINNKKKLFESKSKNFSIAFNGELYNWREIKNSNKNLLHCKNDTELLVNMHEELNPINVAKKIDGMFAYSIFNKKKKEVYFASDVQGEKKLFYYNDDNYLIISSTISSIISFLDKKTLNLDSINSYFATRHYLFFGDTCYDNIKIIEPGNVYTFNLNNNSLLKKSFDNPLSWISEKKMNYFKKMKEVDLVEYFENLLVDQLKKMIPETKFGSIFSGGIDSSLQTLLLSKIQSPNEIITLNHVGKDKITENIWKFQKFIKNKINVLDIHKNDYIKDLQKSYEITQFPFLTHDFVGKYQLSKFFKKKDCKVFFGADGVDELFGGYQNYSKINWKENVIKNHSPYSNFNQSKNINYTQVSKKMNNLWNEAYKRYEFHKNKVNQKIQASLFTDYFIQAVSVGNIGTDIMCSNSGIEPRNVYIQKKIIREIINVPVKYKINLQSKDSKMILKPLLKKIFLKYFPKKLIFKKQGFSGFPNDTKILHGKNLFLRTNYLLKTNFNKDSKITKELEWKLLNLEFFLKFTNIK
jgi:asparagine synthase (glutamine-hydrolysing)